MTIEDLSVDDALVGKVTNYVEEYMSNYDASHDFNHIKRVLRLSQHIQSHTPSTRQDLVTLAALLHDVGDKKYLRPGEDPSRMVASVLMSFGAPQTLADTVQAICLGVSYSSEVKDPARTRALVDKYPELAVVQDADRLDAIGAVGIARTFAFGGAKSRTLENTMEHFDDKLLLLEGMMKTEEGRRMARERTERLRLMKAWWQEETSELKAQSVWSAYGPRKPYENPYEPIGSLVPDQIGGSTLTLLAVSHENLYGLGVSPAIKQVRLTSRIFNTILAKRTFEVLVSFLDPVVAQDTLITIARDPERRRRRPSIWSPRCSVPQNLHVDESFLMALWAGLRGQSWAVEMGANGVKLDIDNWQIGVGISIRKEELREVLFRYALYLSYMSECENEEDVPQAWVFNAICSKA
ncbi:hypothetical protein NOF04DRAFT_1369060 [Fusarium oxysporum II5]|nr:hypothetical protein NOF04DRAFT_1369060 [Fusarium oxysporum II5]